MLGNVGGSIFDPQKAKQDAKVLRWLVFFVVTQRGRKKRSLHGFEYSQLCNNNDETWKASLHDFNHPQEKVTHVVENWTYASGFTPTYIHITVGSLLAGLMAVIIPSIVFDGRLRKHSHAFPF